MDYYQYRPADKTQDKIQDLANKRDPHVVQCLIGPAALVHHAVLPCLMI